MKVPELEQFLNIGEVRVFLRFTLKNVGGGLVGLILSYQLTNIIGLEGLWRIAWVSLFVFVGYWLTTQSRGFMRLHRLTLIGSFLIRWLVRANELPAPTTTIEVDEEAYPVKITRRGETVLATKQERRNL